MRVRLRFAKRGKVRFTSHRDVARQWERALRRAALPVASTEGFSPRPKVHFGLALSTGYESSGEYIDVDLRDPEAGAVDLDGLPALLSPLLPVGIDVESLAVIDRATPSLQEAVTSCSWRIEVVGAGPVAVRAAVAEALAAPVIEVTRERKGKAVTDDIRPAVLALRVTDELPALAGWAPTPDPAGVEGAGADTGGAHEPAVVGAVLDAELATHPRALRPAELVAALAARLPGTTDDGAGPTLEEGRVLRTHQWIVLDGARREPLPPDATRAPHAQARAS